MKLFDLLKILEFGARFKICFFDGENNEVGNPIFHGNFNDFESKGYMEKKSNSILNHTVKVIQTEPNTEFNIVLNL